MRRAFAALAKQELETNEDAVVLLGDISMGLFLNSEEMLPNRCYNIGILEQSMISMAAGMASNGMLPIVHTISAFLIERSLEQIKLDVLYNRNKVILISANGPFDYSKLGPTHHSANDVPLLNDIGFCNLFLPYSGASFVDSFTKAKAVDGASYVRVCKVKMDYIDGYREFGGAKFLGNGTNDCLSVFVGEAAAVSSRMDPKTTDLLFVHDLGSLPDLSKTGYGEITCWEPYGSPVVATKLSNNVVGKKISCMCYPKNIEDGIFAEVEYQLVMTIKT